ncbi:MAG: hypothetical protein WAO10_07380 [Candidatus Sulfotelmatobacter sp.]
MAANKVSAYISEQRVLFKSKAAPIPAEDKAALQPFFPADLLDQVRVVRAKVSDPPFYAQLRSLGIHNMPAFSELAGITFVDIVVHVAPLTRSLFFHELVHVVQYRHLGVAGFADLYVRGFLNGGSYEEIPLEKQAYELEARFAENGDAFSVDEDVQRRRKLGQF